MIVFNLLTWCNTYGAAFSIKTYWVGTINWLTLNLLTLSNGGLFRIDEWNSKERREQC